MPTTNAQVQSYANLRVRAHSELARLLVLLLDDDRSSVDDVYNYLNSGSSTWVDDRQDGPPHLLTGNDVLGFNTFAEDVRNYIKNHGQYPVVLKACVKPPLS